jgi:outer membrane protein insertion porin family
MSATKPILSIRAIYALLVTMVLITAGCGVVPKNYPAKKPFVFKYNVEVEGNFKTEEKNALASRLSNQLDDSIKVRSTRRFFYKGFNRQVLNNPPVYDSNNADRSILYMRALLTALGYFKDTIVYKATVDTVEGDQYRTTVNFKVKPGKQVHIDSFAYNIRKPELQSLAVASQKEAFVKEGDPFAKANISVELDRLVDLYRNNGYMRFSREELYGLWDTLDVSLLRPNLDPLEQLELLQKLRERRNNPTANLEIKLRPLADSNKLKKYFIGNITVMPDSSYNVDTSFQHREDVTINGVRIISYQHMFKPKIIPQNIYLHHGDMYDQRNYFKTINRFNSLGAWRVVNIEQVPRPGQDSADFIVRLTPAKKYSFTANMEASQNQSIISGKLFGIGVNVGLQNKNFARSAYQSTTNIRYGVEFGNKFIQTQQASVSHTIYFPKPIPNAKWIPEKYRNNIRTVFNFNAANTERRQLYNLTTVNGSWGYEYQRNIPGTQKIIQLTWKIPNIEYSYLRERDSLKNLIIANPALKNIFTDGFISSTILGITLTNAKEKTPRVLSANLELPFLAGFIPSNFLDTQLYKFIKINAEFTQQFKFNKKSSFVFRAFGGVGYAYGSTVNPQKQNALPFFKQYFAGGPNSMRAWRLRRLGPGSAIKDFGQNPERFGDVQLEMNLEYRFKLATIAGTNVESVLFSDIGNVWFLKKNAGSPEEVFNFGRLGKDIAIGVGTGLRIDFSFFLIRVDYAYKLKDPSPDPVHAADQNKLFNNWELFNGQLQIGINYPFKL